jgi:hypothetical protein
MTNDDGAHRGRGRHRGVEGIAPSMPVGRAYDLGSDPGSKRARIFEVE